MKVNSSSTISKTAYHNGGNCYLERKIKVLKFRVNNFFYIEILPVVSTALNT